MEKMLSYNIDGAVVKSAKSDDSWQDFVHTMAKRNAYLPPIKRVIYNLKTHETVSKKDENGKPVLDAKGRAIRDTVELASPVLATIVEFADGTKVSVVNSGADAVKTEVQDIKFVKYNADGSKTETKAGKTATVATEASKEAGLVYAIVKRIYGSYDLANPNHVIGNGLGRKLKETVAEAYDTQLEAARNEALKAKAAQDHKDREAAAKARKANRKPSFEDNVAIIADYVRKQTETSETKTV